MAFPGQPASQLPGAVARACGVTVLQRADFGLSFEARLSSRFLHRKHTACWFLTECEVSADWLIAVGSAVTYPAPQLQLPPAHGANAQMSSKPNRQSARVALDEGIQPAGESRVDTRDPSHDADTVPLLLLPEDVLRQLGEAPTPRVEGCDPYSTATSAGGSEKRRRTLDDMRKLSEEIKRGRDRK